MGGRILIMADDDYSAYATVRPSDALHFHICDCGHSWSCVYITCLLVQGFLTPLNPFWSTSRRIPDLCKAMPTA